MTEIPNPSAGAGRRMHALLSELWPLHRTLNCQEMDDALDICGAFLGDDRWQISRYPVKQEVFTWWIPERYKVNEAWLEINGERVADFADNPLHLLSYSLPQKIEGKLGDIRDHIWSRPERPDAIPWEFKYYERSWGFCVRHGDLERFSDDAKVRGVIDVEFGDEPMSIGEIFLPGDSDDEILFLTNICHPAQVNDSIAGLVVALEMAKILARLPERRHGFRVLVVPETIGTVAWAAHNEDVLARTKFAWFCEICGHDNSFILQHSRQGAEALIDKAFLAVLPQHRRHGEERTGEFRQVIASDEIITNGPGFDIPTPSLSRAPYDEYHTSDDNPSIIDPRNLEETLDVMMDVWCTLEGNYYPRRTFKGPVMLSRYGLWIDWRDDLALNLATEKIMLMMDGDRSVIDIAHETGLPAAVIQKYLDRFFEAGLIDCQSEPWDQT